MDSRGRLFVGDRANSRIQIFDQGGKHLGTWTQFGRPSGLFVKDDILYCADSESNAGRNGGWKRGIRIGSVRDGIAAAFIPDYLEMKSSKKPSESSKRRSSSPVFVRPSSRGLEFPTRSGAIEEKPSRSSTSSSGYRN